MSNGPLLLLSVNQTARILGLSPFSVYRLAESRQLPHFKIGSGPRPRLRFDQAEIDSWLRARHFEAKDETRRLRKRQ